MTDLLQPTVDRPFPSLFSIDSFQLSLFDLVDNASDIEIGHFSAYKTADLYRFMIKLFITSLDSNSPQRTIPEKDELTADTDTPLIIDSITSMTSVEEVSTEIPVDEEIDITDSSTDDRKISDYDQNEKPITIVEPYKFNIKEKALYNNWRNLLTNINYTPNIPHTPETPLVVPSVGEEITATDVEYDDDIICAETCEVVSPMNRIRGKMKITSNRILFIPDEEQPDMSSNTNMIPVLPDLPVMTPTASTGQMVNSNKLKLRISRSSINRTFRTSPGPQTLNTRPPVQSKLDDDYLSDRDDVTYLPLANPGMMCADSTYSNAECDTQYFVAINVSSSYQQVGGTRYKLMNVNRYWNISTLNEIYYRRFQLRDCAMELFFNDNTSWLFQFFDNKRRNKVFNAILHLNPPNLIHNSEFFKKPSKAIKTSQIHHKWCRREISNFEYLMKLNKFAGRSFNDLTQYPIMPWVITDFESESLDLNDDKIYRDLSKPVGALDDERLERFRMRYESLMEDIELAEDDVNETPLGVQHAFMYGTHYSSIGIVLYYLLRIEPFTTYNLKFQDGKFDLADRLFHSIKDCWYGCLKSMSDVKELIPEFYYLSEFLVNKQALDLGIATETKQVVNDVLLPPWAKGSAEIFVQVMRKALDSDYVSANLHKWIDLIFGVTQRGSEALKHNNVFHPFTYEGNVNINSIEDPIERRAILKQIDEFGQTPMQLFYKPHKQRLKKSEVLTTIFQAPKVKYYGSYHLTDSRDIGISFLQGLYTNFLTIGSDLCLDIHKWIPGKLMIEKKKSNAWSKKFARISKHKKQNRIGSNFSTKIVNRNLCFTCTQDLKYIFACGFEDFSFVVWDVNTNKSVQGIMQHHDVVSCIALSQDIEKHKAILVTGSYDKSVMVWRVNTRTNKYINNVSPSNSKHIRRHSLISSKSSQILFSSGIGGSNANTANRPVFVNENIVDTTPIHILENQLAPVTCVDISLQSGIIVCCSMDGMINLYNSNTGEHYHILQPYVDMAIKEDERILLREKKRMEKEIQKKRLQKQKNENLCADDELYIDDSDGDEAKYENNLSLADYNHTSMSSKSNINEISTGSLSICKISSNIGQIICYSSDTRNIFLYSSSGELLSYSNSRNDIYYDIKFSKLGNHILCGGREKIVRVKELPSFFTKKKFTECKHIVRQIYVDKDETCMFVGCSTGDVMVYSLTQKAFVQNRVEILGKLGF